MQYPDFDRCEKDRMRHNIFEPDATMNPEVLPLLLTREMPYGKYKGTKLADLPGNYLGWMAREGFPRGELGALLALMYELDHNNLRDLLDPLRHRPGARG
jgi:uncharacterized protein